MNIKQPDLFVSPGYPDGFRYEANLLPAAQEQELHQRFAELPFKEFEFHGFRGKRRVVAFGWRYDFNGGVLTQTEPIPEFLLAVCDSAAKFARLAPANIVHALVTEYQPGATIDWHKDRPQFGDVIGISLLSGCPFRFRRKLATAKWERVSINLEPRSAYLLRGPSRTEWEHIIPALETLRYSITFRTLRNA